MDCYEPWLLCVNLEAKLCIEIVVYEADWDWNNGYRM